MPSQLLRNHFEPERFAPEKSTAAKNISLPEEKPSFDSI